jgi:hypothetical protein
LPGLLHQKEKTKAKSFFRGKSNLTGRSISGTGNIKTPGPIRNNRAWRINAYRGCQRAIHRHGGPPGIGCDNPDLSQSDHACLNEKK